MRPRHGDERDQHQEQAWRKTQRIALSTEESSRDQFRRRVSCEGSHHRGFGNLRCQAAAGQQRCRGRGSGMNVGQPRRGNTRECATFAERAAQPSANTNHQSHGPGDRHGVAQVEGAPDVRYLGVRRSAGAPQEQACVDNSDGACDGQRRPKPRQKDGVCGEQYGR